MLKLAVANRWLRVGSSQSRLTAIDPLQPFEVSTKTRSIQFHIFRGAQDSFLGHLRMNSLTSVEASYLW
mgnify:FL=1